jgi:hypothetical protein
VNLERVSDMRSRLDVTDVVAGLFVAGALTFFAAGLAGAELGGVRARAAAVFIFGALAFAVGARRDAFEDADASGRVVAALTAAGVLTLIVGVTAIILGSEGYIVALVTGICVQWLGATVRHLRSRQIAAVPPTTKPRQLVKR